MDFDAIAAGIAACPDPPPATPGRKRSAVLVPLFLERGELRVLFILRGEDPRFGGQVAFPGGKVEASDENDRETAYRELEEELGIEATHVRDLGKLGHFPTLTSRYDIAVHVGAWSPSSALIPCSREVAAVFSVSLESLWEQSRRRHREGGRGARETVEYEVRALARSVESGGALPSLPVIWGATARILDFLFSCILGEEGGDGGE